MVAVLLRVLKVYSTRDRAKNMNMIKVELAQNLRDVTSNWNMGTARWLKNCYDTQRCLL